MQNHPREQSDRQGFLGKNTLFERSEERKIFSQKPEGLDLARARREATFAFPFWLSLFAGQFTY